MIIRLLKAYKLNTGKVMPRGAVFNRMYKEAEKMIKTGIAEKYTGGFPPKKMKNDFKTKNIKDNGNSR